MTHINLDENKLKEIFKMAILELMQEQKEVFFDFFMEMIEEVALERAIKEGEETENVSREVMLKILDKQA